MYLDSLDTFDQSLKNLSDVSSILHGDNAKMIFLINPHEESLGFVVIDSSALKA